MEKGMMTYKEVEKEYRRICEWKENLSKVYKGLSDLDIKYKNDYLDIYYTQIPYIGFVAYPEYHCRFIDGKNAFLKEIERITNIFCKY